jgi:uncharacterized Tic20 family protein
MSFLNRITCDHQRKLVEKEPRFVMPIAVVCPHCKAKLKAPDTLIGKTVKCPGCANPVLVKSVAVAPAATSVKTAPKKKPIPEDYDEEPIDDVESVEDEEEEEELDERPKKKKKKKGDSRSVKTGDSTDSERTMALFIHIGAHIVNLVAGGLGIFVPVLIWMVKRKDSRFIDHHGKTWLNFTLSMFVVAVGLLVVLGGLTAGGFFIKWWLGMIFMVLLIICFAGLALYSLIMNIVAAIKAKKGEWYEYRCLFRPFK